MAKYKPYRCPDCDGVFKHLHVLSDDPPPDRCPLCGSWVSEDAPQLEPVFVPQAPRIAKSPYSKSVDQTYNGMMDASVKRADEAGDMLDDQLRAAGVDDDERRRQVFELKSGLKITNMRDPSEMREGDTAAIMPPVSEAQKNLSVGMSKPGFQMLEGGVPDHAPGLGGHRPGMTAAQTITADHHNRAVSMIRAGEMNRYVPPKP